MLRRILLVASSGLAGALVFAIAAFVYLLESRPDLDAWHVTRLQEEFTAQSKLANFQDYLRLEERLFRELDNKIYLVAGAPGDDIANRYKRGSLADPGRWPTDWNRSFQLGPESAPAVVLLLHGMSDSPYSLRHLGQRLAESGVAVLGLRLPGHGTIPAGLASLRLDDMTAAVRLAMRHLRQEHPGSPIYIAGYSNGAALGLDYALDALADTTLPPVAGLVQISPAIGVTPVAGLAVWQARLGWLLGLKKLAWNSIGPEYDPFKYVSFAVNAAALTHQLTGRIQEDITRLAKSGDLARLPPILAFVSAVDATVSAMAVVDHQFNRLPRSDNELVLFDINRMEGIEPLLRWSPAPIVTALQNRAGEAYALSLVTNRASASPEVQVLRWRAQAAGPVTSSLGLAWPDGIYSMSHVALPFPIHDPLYGAAPSEPSPGIQLGDIAMLGERDVLKISPAAMLRLRWNPFYPYLEQRTLEFLGL